LVTKSANNNDVCWRHEIRLRNISINYIYIYNKTSIKEIFSPSNKIHREVGRAKVLSAPRYIYVCMYVCVLLYKHLN